MHGVDFAVLAAPEVVGPQVACVVVAIVAAAVVVLDLQIVILEEALRDDEVVRLVAGRELRKNLPRAGEVRGGGDRRRQPRRTARVARGPRQPRRRPANHRRDDQAASTTIHSQTRSGPVQMYSAAGTGPGSHGARTMPESRRSAKRRLVSA